MEMEREKSSTYKNSSHQNELTELLDRLAQPQLPPEQRKSLFSKIRESFDNFKRQSAPQSGSAGTATEKKPQMDSSLLDAHQKIVCAIDDLEASSPETQQWKDNLRLLQDHIKKC